jgi:beta-RFAP synthase
MSPRAITVRSPSRLHFGLLSFGGDKRQLGDQGRQFGGVGVMVARPGIDLRITPAEAFEAAGPLAERVREFAARWARSETLPDLPACRVEVVAAPPAHVGLGVGTQLGLSVAAGLSALAGRPNRSPLELAASVGRGLRSAVGTYGFAHGGLIVERGKLPREPLAPLDFRADLPDEWRFVLVCPRTDRGLSGAAEQTAFAELPPVPHQLTEQLRQELRLRLLPALVARDFDQFSESLYRFGTAAGECFARRQGGPFNGPLLTELVRRMRATGVSGVGQSSWGPTLFALLPNEARAESFAAQLLAESPEPLDVLVTPPCNAGAQIHAERNS